MKPYYSDSFATIWHGDCREILPSISPVDLILTDPPYGIGEAAGKNKTRGNHVAAKDYGNDSWDDQIIEKPIIELMASKADWLILFGGNYYAHYFTGASCWLVWDKDNGDTDFADCELAYTNLPGAVRRLKWRWNGYLREIPEQRDHPTQKPLGLIKWCIRQADEKTKKPITTILDPFMGSGTTLRAAKDLQRKSIGIELSEKYCEIAAKRLRQEVLPLI